MDSSGRQVSAHTGSFLRIGRPLWGGVWVGGGVRKVRHPLCVASPSPFPEHPPPNLGGHAKDPSKDTAGLRKEASGLEERRAAGLTKWAHLLLVDTKLTGNALGRVLGRVLRPRR